MNQTHFERAIFISWYCSKRDCAFCYLSSRKNVNQDPIKDRRSLSSILAEAIICKACGWKTEFISGGCDTYTDEELLKIIKNIYKITKQKQWQVIQLPLKCSECQNEISVRSLEWIGDDEARCPFCSNDLEIRTSRTYN